MGYIIVNNKKYIFRTDHGHGNDIWAWDYYDENYDSATVHKWKVMPKNHQIEYFNIETPPQTVSYNPLIN